MKVECEIYSRISGYYRSTRNWNKGKKEEFKERKTYDKNIRNELLPEVHSAEKSM